jgi:hypothetical protein
MTTAATETGIAITWLDGVLRGDTGTGGIVPLSTGGIHEEIDPTGNKVYPKTIYRFQGGSDFAAVGAKRRVYVNALYAVYATWQLPNYNGALDQLAGRIDLLLNGQRSAVDGGLMLACVRVTPLRMSNLSNGVSIRILGGVYRIYSQLTAQSS